MKTATKTSEAGMTFVEIMLAATLIATFFASIFELNAVCLRYIDATKESVAALQSVQDRAEMLRNLSFTDLVNTTVVRLQSRLWVAEGEGKPVWTGVSESVDLSEVKSLSKEISFMVAKELDKHGLI